MIKLLLGLALVTFLGFAAYGEETTIGVSSALTGDAAAFGVDIKNALQFANTHLTHNRYKFIFEDDKCSGKDATAVASKLLNIDKVKYVLGFACNQALLAAAPVYRRAGVTVLTSSATSGDILDIGENIFRLFPADQGGAELIYPYMIARHKRIGVLTEQNEYSELIQRALVRLNKQDATGTNLVTEEFTADSSDVRPQLLRLKQSGIDALFVNTNAEPTFIRAVQQMGQIGFGPMIYAEYWPASEIVLKEVGRQLEGAIFANLPSDDEFLSPLGKSLMRQFTEQYGPPQSGASVVPVTIESLRILDLALKSGKPVDQYLRTTKFSGGMIGEFNFDAHGAVAGINFQLQTIRDGKVTALDQKRAPGS